MSDNSLFTAEIKELEIDPEKDYLPDLVGEGKKFKTEQDLARSVLHKESHIARIERENAELREEVKKRLNMEEFLRTVEDSQRKLINTGTNVATSAAEPTNTGEADEIKPLSREDILKVLAEKDELDQRRNNLNSVKQTLMETLGNDYVVHIKEKAKELNVSDEWLNEIAARNPQAFLKLMDVNSVKRQRQETESLFSTRNSSVNTSSLSTPRIHPSGAKTWKQWQEVRKSNPTAYFDNYSQVHKDALTLGEAFYN